MPSPVPHASAGRRQRRLTRAVAISDHTAMLPAPLPGAVPTAHDLSMNRLRPFVLVVLIAICVATPAAAQGPPAAPETGLCPVPDPVLPFSGNCGFTVSHYDMDLSWFPDDGSIAAITTLTLTADRALPAFDLDLTGFSVSSVTVDGIAATFNRAGQELTV